MIDAFRGEYRWLSNFERSPVKLEGIEFPTVEHAYQAAKNPSNLYRAHLLSMGPAEARRRGQTCELRPDWENVKIDVMLDLIAQKFAIGSELADRLLATGDQDLVEGNTWGDTFWGVCNGVGYNHLGRLLMAQRAALRRDATLRDLQHSEESLAESNHDGR